MILLMVKVTKKDDNLPVLSPTQRKTDKKLKHTIEIPDKISSYFSETLVCLCGMMSTHQINSVTSPSLQVF